MRITESKHFREENTTARKLSSETTHSERTQFLERGFLRLGRDFSQEPGVFFVSRGPTVRMPARLGPEQPLVQQGLLSLRQVSSPRKALRGGIPKSIFGHFSPKVVNNAPMAPRTHLGCPHEGPFVAWVDPRQVTSGNLPKVNSGDLGGDHAKSVSKKSRSPQQCGGCTTKPLVSESSRSAIFACTSSTLNAKPYAQTVNPPNPKPQTPNPEDPACP
jgi:hypothetical protein